MIDFNQLDKTIHERGRLSIMTVLAARRRLTFQELKTQLDMSDGNLITHLRALTAASFVTASKNPDKRQTHYSLTPHGRHAFKNYLALLESIINLSNPKP